MGVFTYAEHCIVCLLWSKLVNEFVNLSVGILKDLFNKTYELHFLDFTSRIVMVLREQCSDNSLTQSISPTLDMNKDTDVAPEVVAQASSHQVVGLLLLPQTVQGQSLHRQGLCRETIQVQQTVRNTVHIAHWQQNLFIHLSIRTSAAYLHALQTWGWIEFVCRT